MRLFLEVLGWSGLIVLSPFAVYLLVKVAVFAALKAKREFKEKYDGKTE